MNDFEKTQKFYKHHLKMRILISVSKNKEIFIYKSNHTSRDLYKTYIEKHDKDYLINN